MNIKQRLQSKLRTLGYDLQRFSPTSSPLARRKALIEANNISLILDVGANTGQFVREMRDDTNFSGKIISFEPLSDAYKILEKNSKNDHNWHVRNYALGDVENSSADINISKNSYSSSILGMLPRHYLCAENSEYVGSELINITTLDSIFQEIDSGSDNIYLKIDTQGFESQVLEGANNSLSRIDIIQVEMSIVPLYNNQLLFRDMLDLLFEKGFTLVSIEPGFTDNDTGQLLQFDGIFLNNNKVN